MTKFEMIVAKLYNIKDDKRRCNKLNDNGWYFISCYNTFYKILKIDYVFDGCSLHITSVTIKNMKNGKVEILEEKQNVWFKER